MAALSSIFWVLGLILSVTIAPQLRIWTWGPSMLCLCVAALLALPGLWKDRRNPLDLLTLASGFAVSVWIIVRAYISPVFELAISDALLVCMAVSTFIVFRNSCQHSASEKILLAGITGMLAATLGVIAIQVGDGAFSPIFPQTGEKPPSGFHGHYSYCASFLIPCSLILIAQGLVRGFHWSLRVLFLLVGAAAMVALFYTFSRGGVVGAGFGMAALVTGVILLGFRERKSWFFPLAIISPIVLLGVIAGMFVVLGNVQESRGGEGLANMMDNFIRLYLLNIAVSCAQTHLFFGGGSRSFSWECFQFWDIEAFGLPGAKPEHVHNELVQTICDYGLVGGILLSLFIIAIAMKSLVNHLSKSNAPETKRFDAWRIGGMAGFVGLFVQSNFEGIFRIPPGAILLGLCLAAMTAVKQDPKKPLPAIFPLRNGLTTLVVLGSVVLMGFFGFKSTASLPHLWPAYFSEIPIGNETKIDALSAGIARWPLQTLLLERARVYRDLSDSTDDPEYRRELSRRSLTDLMESSRLHPYDPYSLLTGGKALQKHGEKKRANTYFLNAVKVQGGMESLFGANQAYSKFLLETALETYDEEEPLETINQLQLASGYIDASWEQTAGNMASREGHELMKVVNISLGQAYEASAQYEQALERFDYTTTLRNGNSANYLGALLLGEQAVSAWYDRRQSDALRLFIEAEKRLAQTRELPPGVKPSTSYQYREYLKDKIKFLTDTNIIPSSEIHF